MNKKDHLRDKIIEEHLLDFVDAVSTSARNKEIVIRYVSGESQSCLAHAYKVSRSVIHQIIFTYYSNAHKYMSDNERVPFYSHQVIEQDLTSNHCFDINPVSEEERKKALEELFANEIKEAPFLSKEVFPEEDIRDNIVDYMVSQIKNYYGVSDYKDALKLWNKYRDEVLD